MEHVIENTKGLRVLFDVNNDRLLSILIILLAMAAVALVGVEYASSFMVQQQIEGDAVSGLSIL